MFSISSFIANHFGCFLRWPILCYAIILTPKNLNGILTNLLIKMSVINDPLRYIQIDNSGDLEHKYIDLPE
jgi:hypothetical protein